MPRTVGTVNRPTFIEAVDDGLLDVVALRHEIEEAEQKEEYHFQEIQRWRGRRQQLQAAAGIRLELLHGTVTSQGRALENGRLAPQRLLGTHVDPSYEELHQLAIKKRTADGLNVGGRVSHS